MPTRDLLQPASADVPANIATLCASSAFGDLPHTLNDAPAFSVQLGAEFANAGAVAGIPPCRMLRGCLYLPLGQFFVLLGQLFESLGDQEAPQRKASPWPAFADAVMRDPDLGETRLLAYLEAHVGAPSGVGAFHDLERNLIESNLHAIYPTSTYCECDSGVEATPDQQTVEAVMSFSTFSSIRIIYQLIDVGQPALRDICKPLGRCICLIDSNVAAEQGAAIDAYFGHHSITLEKCVYRAMEADKGLATVERMLGDFKRLGVSRNEPVLIAGGGVFADTGGLACALYRRNTPHVMVSTSIVNGIDAGPSPRHLLRRVRLQEPGRRISPAGTGDHRPVLQSAPCAKAGCNTAWPRSSRWPWSRTSTWSPIWKPRSRTSSGPASAPSSGCAYPRSGRGIDMPCSDVRLEDPSRVMSPRLQETAK